MSRRGLEVTLVATALLWIPVAIQASSTAPPASRAADTVIVTEERASMSSVAFSPDGRTVASSGVDGRVHLWDAVTGEELVILDAHRGEAYGVAFSPDGNRIVTGGQDGTVRLWDTASGRLERSWEAEPWPMDLVFSPDGDELLVVDVDGQVLVHPLEGGRADTLASHGSGGVAAAWASAEDRIALSFAGASDGLLVRRREVGASSHPLRGHGHVVLDLAFTPDGGRLVSGSSDASIRVWDLERAVAVDTLTRRMPIPFVALSPDGERLAAGGADGTVRLWSMDDLDGDGELLSEHARSVTGVAFSPSGDRVASSGLDGRVRIVQLDGADDARRTSAAAELQQESGPDLLRRAVDGLLPDSLRTEVLVLGSTHLSRYADRFRPELLDRLIAALEAWEPDAVGVERDPPEVHARIGAGPEPEVGRAMQERLGVELDRAVAVADSLLDRAEGGETLVDDRLALVRYLVAAHRLPTATLHWMRLSEDMRAEADLPEQARQALEARADGPANEIYSLGLRLARVRGLEQVHPIDDATSERVLDLERAAAEGGLRERLADHPTYEPLADYMGAERRRVSEAIDAGDLLPFYRWKNDPETIARDVRLQWGIFLELAPELPLAQKRIVHWEVRNLKMATHIRKMTLHHPGERILVVVGAGHKAFFDAYLDQMLDVEVVQLEEVLFS